MTLKISPSNRARPLLPSRALLPYCVTSPAPDSREAGGQDCNVLRVVYPAGSTAPRHKDNVGGLNFYGQPLSIDRSAHRVKTTTTLSYEVRFSDDFDWVKGGKLPGLYGGRGASGGLREDQDLEAGFSARLMWRAEGLGEVYLYFPQDQPEDILGVPPKTIVDPSYGISLGRGAFTFARGRWTSISLRVTTSSVGGAADGKIRLDVDGQHNIVAFDKLRFPRACTEEGEVGLFFSTFFGGHDASWAPSHDQEIHFRRFALFSSCAD
ncbi:hypothetical protein FA10DRAFT_76395 [Acaromyces ingoldii]|uniref:Polysaccharide lyase 14 domain-containing protein n=1 Tax=Acaromyces ingoldii TaxID=215250 RepID=A0A316YSM6_9BASI|nr:hypothetical protein FA10DRAFT_76395 [Acaromyces ingoldii]PWN91834.1 hypothetical protein FA10DRAFT_76395 [Acaromyces ingoldii]